MIIKKAKFKKVTRIVNERVSDEVYGCDQCKKEIGERTLDITIFHHKGESEYKNLCSWKCVIKFVPTIKTDYFVSLPYLHYDEKIKGITVADFIKATKK